MYESISLDPDGAHLLATRVERPFSYITGWTGFPRNTQVLALTGEVLATVHKRPLREGG